MPPGISIKPSPLITQSLAPGRSQQEPALPLPFPHVKKRENGTAARFGISGPYTVLCPGAEYGPAKRWPARYFAELAQKLAAAGFDIWLVGSAKDAAIGGEIARLIGNPCVNLCGKSTLAEAIDLMSCAALVVSNDSGLMHIAAALDKPLTAIYGSSSPAFTPPLSTRAQVVKLDLPCSPCFRRECPLGHFNCMLQLTPERVWNRIEFGKIPRS